MVPSQRELLNFPFAGTLGPSRIAACLLPSPHPVAPQAPVDHPSEGVVARVHGVRATLDEARARAGFAATRVVPKTATDSRLALLVMARSGESIGALRTLRGRALRREDNVATVTTRHAAPARPTPVGHRTATSEAIVVLADRRAAPAHPTPVGHRTTTSEAIVVLADRHAAPALPTPVGHRTATSEATPTDALRPAAPVLRLAPAAGTIARRRTDVTNPALVSAAAKLVATSEQTAVRARRREDNETLLTIARDSRAAAVPHLAHRAN
jgi:hypothetical protein